MMFSEVMALPVKERGAPLHALAEAGDNDACLEYAKIVFGDKYKGTPSEGQSKDDAKSEARADAPRFLLEAARRGHVPSIVLGKKSTFEGVFLGGQFGKTLCKVNFNYALEFLDLWLTQEELEPSDRALTLLRKGLCLKLINAETPWDEVAKLWKEAASLEGEYAIAAGAQLGAWHYENGRYEEAESSLLPAKDTSIMASSLLMLIYKNHIKSEENYQLCKAKCLELCNKKPPKGQS